MREDAAQLTATILQAPQVRTTRLSRLPAEAGRKILKNSLSVRRGRRGTGLAI
jgi:hypothetical protein